MALTFGSTGAVRQSSRICRVIFSPYAFDATAP